MMEVRNIHKRFGKQEVLKGIDMDVAKGEVVTLLGPSGSGKTTFLRCLNFLERADEGSILLGETETIVNKANPKGDFGAPTPNRDGLSKLCVVP